MVENNTLLIPVLIQIAATLLLYIHLAIAKARAKKLGLVNEARRALHDDAWPEDVIKINNSIRNQFELPVLFYVLVVLAWVTNNANLTIQALAWLFVTTRIIHLLVHVGPNYVPLRRRVFMFGWVLIMIFTVYLTYLIVLRQNI